MFLYPLGAGLTFVISVYPIDLELVFTELVPCVIPKPKLFPSLFHGIYHIKRESIDRSYLTFITMEHDLGFEGLVRKSGLLVSYRYKRANSHITSQLKCRIS